MSWRVCAAPSEKQILRLRLAMKLRGSAQYDNSFICEALIGDCDE